MCESTRSVVVEHVMRKAAPPPFLLKTYMVVEDPATDAVVSWNDGGTAFVVWQPAEFSRDLLPTLFKHGNFSSFVRQLNTYGFRKVATNRWEFSNDKFLKGKRDELCNICRRKSTTSNKPKPNVQQVQAASKDHHSDNEDQRSSSTSSSSSELTNLVDENKRLKVENGVLVYELDLVKKKCDELLDLVSVYGGLREKEEEFNGGEDGNEEEEGCFNGGLKLFGVRMEVENKRKRPGRELMLA